jgi:hypothetical protein
MPDDTATKFIAESDRFGRDIYSESVETGPTIWLLGSPAPAPDGMVGLATTATQTVCFRSEDILEARETEGRYLIKIRADTNVLVREDHVVKLNPSDCRCQESSETIVIAKKKGSSDQPTKPSGPILPRCYVDTVCIPTQDPETGAVIRVCWPTLVCGGGGTPT